MRKWDILRRDSLRDRFDTVVSGGRTQNIGHATVWHDGLPFTIYFTWPFSGDRRKASTMSPSYNDDIPLRQN